MKSMTAVEAQNKFGQLIEAAQRRPIAITKHGRATVVVMSMEDYERSRSRAWDKVIESARRSSEYAKQRGLTQSKLDKLLADES